MSLINETFLGAGVDFCKLDCYIDVKPYAIGNNRKK